MLQRTRAVFVLTTFVCAWAARLDAQGGPPVPVSDTAGLAALSERLRVIVRESPVAGVGVAVVSKHGRPWSVGVGEADVASGAPVGPGTRFRANSVSKSFVALALLRLHEQGRLPLDAELRDVAPEIQFHNPWQATHPVRVVHLLEHTTGFDDLHLREYAFEATDGTLRDALAVNPAPRTARWPPGTAMAYNNGGYAIAAYLIERVTGQPFEDFIASEVLRPIGMHESGFGLERIDTAALATHYAAPGVPEPPAPYPLLIRPAGGLVTSARDMASFVAFLLRREPRLLTDSAWARLRTPRTTEAAQAGLGAGYALGSYSARGEGWTWYGHAGGTPSAFARYAYQPELGVGYAILMNGADAVTKRRIESALQRHLVAGQEPPAPPRPPLMSDEEAAAYVGIYRQATSSWQITAGVERLFDAVRVEASDGTLRVSPLLGGPAEVLLPAGRDRFRSADAPELTAVFLRDDEGTVTGLRTWDADNIRAGNHARVSRLSVWAPLVLLCVGLPLLLSVLLVAPLRLGVARLRGAVPATRPLLRLPFLAAATLVAAVGVLVVGVADADLVRVLGRPGFTAVAFWLLMWMFAALSAASFVHAVRTLFRRRPGGPMLRLYTGAVALAAIGVAGILLKWGVIGVRFWAF